MALTLVQFNLLTHRNSDYEIVPYPTLSEASSSEALYAVYSILELIVIASRGSLQVLISMHFSRSKAVLVGTILIQFYWTIY